MTNSKVIALDRKTIKGVGSSSKKYPIHIVSTFCKKNNICLAQEKVGHKNNEITYSGELLNSFRRLCGTIVQTNNQPFIQILSNILFEF